MVSITLLTGYNNKGGLRRCLIKDDNNNIVDIFNFQNEPLPLTITSKRKVQTGDKLAISYDNRYDIPVVLFLSHLSIENQIAELEVGSKIMYISPTGSDDNPGSYSSPKKTIKSCLDNGANKIIVADGEYDESVDVSSYGRNISIIADNGAAPIIMNRKIIVNNGSEIADSEYVNVYHVPVDSEPSEDWLYQHLVNDVNTLVLEDEIHPLQRGNKYRCDSTLIKKVPSSVTGLSNIKNYINTEATNNNYYWHFENSTLYFSRPQQSSSAHPIVEPVGHAFFSGSSENEIFISGISFYYGNCEINRCDKVTIQNCRVKYANMQGAFRWLKCRCLKFINCEAARAKLGTYGDGFNGQGSISSSVRVVMNTVYLINCWSHDNNDDGYSDHDCCEAQLIGGLYEYNQKGGVTPSFGSHCIGYNILSRRNINGFYYIGTLRGDLSINGNALFMNCISQNNMNSGYRVSGIGNENVPNSMLLYLCMSSNNETGYKNESATLKLTNCYSNNDTFIKGGSVTVENGEIVI